MSIAHFCDEIYFSSSKSFSSSESHGEQTENFPSPGTLRLPDPCETPCTENHHLNSFPASLSNPVTPYHALSQPQLLPAGISSASAPTTPRYLPPGTYPASTFPAQLYYKSPLLPSRPVASTAPSVAVSIGRSGTSDSRISELEQDFSKGLFHGVLPDRLDRPQRRKADSRKEVSTDDRLLVFLRCMRKTGFQTIGELLAALLINEPDQKYNKHPTVYQSIAAFLHCQPEDVNHHPISIINTGGRAI
jgi:hypothetical protein